MEGKRSVSGRRLSPKALLLPAWRHTGSRGRRRTDLLCEAPRPQEESQKTPDDHSQHRHDEEPILFADVLHPHPHCVQSHGHLESPGPASYQQPINVPNPKRSMIQVWGWNQKEQKKRKWRWRKSSDIQFLRDGFLKCFNAPSGSASPLVLWLRQSALS